ncbi:MAG: multicopper oxidase domain-containing protein [Saprospiraceae bacterium]|nr:multicopper oxidase domain-containing protein [Saprospiraceae bacterium]
MTTHKKNYLLTASEFNWKIPENRNIRAWGFNGQLPGPVLRAKKGEELVVQFTNLLPEQPTIIHWHGLQIPNSMDGTELAGAFGRE